jgi:hypothetical protein
VKVEHLAVLAFRQPRCVTSFRLDQWDLLIRQARHANVLAILHAELKEQGLLESLPPQALEHLEWSVIIAERHTHAVRAEVRHIRKALADLNIPVMLLKGAAYVMAKLPSARGRTFSDIDILVPKSSLGQVEAALMLHGWASMLTDAYDQRYYREWMHELPPMQHLKRQTTIDVHHAIVPDTAAVHPDPLRLLASATAVDETGTLTVLAPADMVLHSAVHLFNDGEFDNGLRDLIDIHRLLRHFGSSAAFWTSLIERAHELDLTRPLFYALRYARLLLHTPVPSQTAAAAEMGRPGKITLAIMDQLLPRALAPNHASCADRFTRAARHLLYLRGNWLRMPPLLLARHLFHKAFISPKAE